MNLIKNLFNKKPLLITFILIASLGFIIYSNSFDAPFVFDDMHNIKDNPYVRMTEIKPDYLKKLEKFPCDSRIIPNLSFALDYFFHRYETQGYHYVNTIIHILNAFVIFLIFRQTLYLTGNKSNITAAVAALVWLVNPVHTQSVTYIVQRMTSMCALFYLLSLYTYIKARLEFIKLSKINKSQILYFALSFIFFICALLSKEIAATLPVFILLYDWFFIKNLNTDFLKKNYKWIISGVAFFILIALYFLGDSPLERILSGYNYRDFTLTERLLTQPRIIIFYISILFLPLPSRLNLEHHINVSTSLIDPFTTILSILLIVGLISAAIYYAKKYRVFSFAVLWFFGNLAIESSFIALELVFEHRTYLPSVFVFFAVVYYMFQFKKHYKYVAVFFTAVILIFSGLTLKRNYTWSDAIRFHKDCLSKSPEKPRVVLNMGVVLYQDKEFEKALKYFKKTLDLKPGYYEPYAKIGATYDKLGEYNKAIEYLNKALELKPDFMEGNKNIAKIYIKLHEYDKAIVHLNKTLQIYPDYIKARIHLGNAYLYKNNYQKALNQFNKVLQIDNEFYPAYNNIGKIYMNQNQLEKAVIYFKKALKYNKKSPEANFNLGVISFSKKDYSEAENYLLKALESDPEAHEIKTKIGDLYFKWEKYSKAEKYYTKALETDNKLLRPKIQLGIINLKNNNYKKAKKYFSKVVELKGNNFLLYYYLGLTELIENNFSAGIENLKKSIKKNPGFIKAKEKLADAYKAKGSQEKALKTYNNILSVNNSNFHSLKNSAEIYFKKGLETKALKLYEKAYKIDNSDSVVIQKLAYLYADKNDYLKSALKFEELQKYHDINPVILFNTACMYSEAHKTDKALENLKKAVNAGYNNKEKILNDKNLDNIRNTVEFMDIAEQL
jgi:tetratricopeptide (TPR) repeat protein